MFKTAPIPTRAQPAQSAIRLCPPFNAQAPPTRPAGGCEWLETDGLGGFASGTVDGIRSRRYHGLLVAATTPPAGRSMLVNGHDAWLETPEGRVPLTAHRYAPGVIHPLPIADLVSFSIEPWPRWIWKLPQGIRIEHELLMVKGTSSVGSAWRVRGAKGDVTLRVRPLISGRDYHSLHHENPVFQFDAQLTEHGVRWQPYRSIVPIDALTNGHYHHEPVWYRQFLYEEERLRGFDCTEDLASPGWFEFDLSKGEAVLVFSADSELTHGPDRPARELLNGWRSSERLRRSRFTAPMDRCADAYLVQRGGQRTILAGYPWFADWGRDTFIAIRGLYIAAGRLEEAESVLLGWAGAVSNGMLPNRFPDSSSGRADAPAEFNAVDASLWYVVAVFEFLEAAMREEYSVELETRHRLQRAILDIVRGYANGTRFGIRADHDGLLAAGERGQQLTWMDARVNGREITPRIGKPVEVQALWINALWIASRFDRDCLHLYQSARGAFESRFWNDERGCLYDVVDVDHQAGRVDDTIRPNQIFAVGGLPLQLMVGPRARAIVDRVESDLLTPLGLRSLAPCEPGYVPRYEGGPSERDGAYHQGTVWPWLIGPFVEAWVRVRGDTTHTRREARRQFLEPMLPHLHDAGLGHVSEIADAQTPHAPRGCPFQAWSLGELMRLDRRVLAECSTTGGCFDVE